jgi:hypothetical protein
VFHTIRLVRPTCKRHWEAPSLAFSAYFLCEWQINQVRLDELHEVLSALREGEVSADEVVERLSRSPRWVWTAIDPETKLLLSVQVGEGTLEGAGLRVRPAQGHRLSKAQSVVRPIWHHVLLYRWLGCLRASA